MAEGKMFGGLDFFPFLIFLILILLILGGMNY